MKTIKRCARVGVLAWAIIGALAASARPASAAPINLETWYDFSFIEAGTPAAGCFPADPDGDFCITSSGSTHTALAPAPAWTFMSATDALLTVTDLFESHDQFEVFDFGVSLGLTSLPALRPSVSCGSDPLDCLGTSGISHGVFALNAGLHSLTIVPRLADEFGGSAAFAVNAVPEPASLVLVGSGIVGLVTRIRRRRHGRASAGRAA